MVRKNGNGGLEINIKGEWVRVIKNIKKIDDALELEKGEERVVSSSAILSAANFPYEIKYNSNSPEHNYDSMKDQKENGKKSNSNRIAYVF